jgi:hypothetical protein
MGRSRISHANPSNNSNADIRFHACSLEAQAAPRVESI